MRRIIFTITFFLVTGTVISSIRCSATGQDPSTVVVKNAAIFLQLTDYKTFLSQFNKMDLYSTLNNNSLLKEFVRKTKEKTSKNGVLGNVSWQDIKPLLELHAEFGLYPSDKALNLIFSFQVKDKKLFDNLVDKVVVKNTKQTLENKIDQVQVTQADLGGTNGRFYYYYRKGKIVGATSLDQLKQTIQLVKGDKELSLINDPVYSNTKKLIRGERTFLAYFNMEKLMDYYKKKLEDVKGVEPSFLSNRLSAVKTTIISGQMVKNGFEISHFTLPSNMEQAPWNKLLNTPPSKLSIIEYFPQDMLFINVSNQNGIKLFLENLLSDLNNITPGQPASVDNMNMQQGVRELEKSLGINLEEEVIPVLGQQLAIGITFLRNIGLFRSPQLVLAMEIKDTEKCLNLLRKIEPLIQQKYKNVKFLDIPYKNKMIRTFTLNFVSPSYVMDKSVLLMGSSSEILKELLQVKEKMLPSFSQVRFKNQLMKTWLPGSVNSMGYINVGDSALVLYELVKTFGVLVPEINVDNLQKYESLFESLSDLGIILSYQKVDKTGSMGKMIFSMKEISN